jgi:hypothetical protein
VIPNLVLVDHEESVKPRAPHLDAILMRAALELCICITA